MLLPNFEHCTKCRQDTDSTYGEFQPHHSAGDFDHGWVEVPVFENSNSDDWYLPGGLAKLLGEFEKFPDVSAVYGRSWNMVEKSGRQYPVWVEPFNERRLALRCIISQPATLIRRSAWEAVGGLDEKLHMAMDYDLWWRLFKQAGPLQFLDDFVAVNREHEDTKTKTQRRRHYREAMQVVRKYYGRVPLKWWIAQPYAVWYKSISLILRKVFFSIS